MSFHYNNLTGITAWSSLDQAYYFVPFADVKTFFSAIKNDIAVPNELIDATYNFLSSYDPKTEAVLITLNEDLLTVAVVSKDQKASREALAEQLGWSLPRLTAFLYLYEELEVDNDTLSYLFKLSNDEFDKVLNVLLS